MNTLNKIVNELRFGHLEKPVKDHLKNVYGAMSVGLLLSFVGVYVNIYMKILAAGLLTSLMSIGMLIYLLYLPAVPENFNLRYGLFNAIALLSGVSLGPLVNMAIGIDPSIVSTAFLGTSLVFVCFTLSALLARDRKFLALGGVLMTGLSSLLILGLLNLFFGSQLIFQVELYLGLAVMCGFVLFDTQMVIEKRRNGDEDVVRHCLDLFLDFVSIFRHILVILISKEDRERRRRRRSD